MCALRMRVSMSEIGSVMVMVGLPSPARLGDAGDLPGVHHLAEADPAEAELAVHGVRTTAPLAPRVGAHLELRCALLLLDERSEEHTSELQSLMRTSSDVLCLKQKNTNIQRTKSDQ